MPRDSMRERQALVAYEQSKSTYDVPRLERLVRKLQKASRIIEVMPFGFSRHEDSPLIEQRPIEEGLRLRVQSPTMTFAVPQ